MRVTLVVHENNPLPKGGASVVLRPVVNEGETNREWSPGTTPAGELRLQVTHLEGAKAFKPGARFDLDLTPIVEKPAAKASTK